MPKRKAQPLHNALHKGMAIAGIVLTCCSTLQAAEASPYRLQVGSQAFRLQLPDRTDHLPYADLVRAAAQRHQLEPALLHAVIAQESGYQASAVSQAGAQGLMQLMPATAARFGVRDSHAPAQNIEAGARYLRLLLNRYQQNLDLALAAYNAGEGAVDAHGRNIPPYAETRRYVPRVKDRYATVREAGNPYRLQQGAVSALRPDRSVETTASQQQQATD